MRANEASKDSSKVVAEKEAAIDEAEVAVEVNVAGESSAAHDVINPFLSQDTQRALKKASTRFRGSSSGLIHEI